MTDICDIAVVGGGITGLTAAHHAALEGRSVLHFVGSGVPGGLVANVGELEGFPSAGPISALDLALRLTEANRQLGVEVIADDVTLLEVQGPLKQLQSASGPRRALTVIAASGASLRMIDVPGARRLTDKGVSQCAWCNGSLYRGGEIVVIGGGDSALQEALHLAKFASLVTIVARGPALRARRSLVDRAADNERIAFRWETDVVEVLGEEAVAGVALRDRATSEIEIVPCRGVFVYVGLQPNTQWLAGQAKTDPDGYLVTSDAFATSLDGVYAAGAIRSGYLGRLTNAVGEATAAALAASRNIGDRAG